MSDLQIDETDRVMFDLAESLLEQALADLRAAKKRGLVFRLRGLGERLEAAAVISATIVSRHKRAELSGWPEKPNARPFFSKLSRWLWNKPTPTGPQGQETP